MGWLARYGDRVFEVGESPERVRMTPRYLTNDLSRVHALFKVPKRYVWHRQAPLYPSPSPVVVALLEILDWSFSRIKLRGG